jgi:hypothetical protein
MATRKQQSDSPVAAEEQLAEARGETGEEGTPLEQQAKEQKAQQSEELASGKGSGSTEKDKLVKKGLVAAARRQPGTPVNQAKMDNLSVRSGADALEGHFVTLDFDADGVKDGLKSVGLVNDDDDVTVGTDSLFVFLEPVDVDPDTGVPETVLVRPRSSAQAFFTVPYEALSRTERAGA